MDQNDEQQDVFVPDSPHEKTPFSESEPKELTPAPLPPLRPPPQQRPHSAFEAGSSATLPARPLSTASIDATTGDFIYDKLPETLPRPPKAKTVTVPPMKPVTEEGNMAEPTNNQPSPPPEVVEKSPEGEEKEDPYPRDHKTCTIITMVLCGLILNIFAFACLIPAYYFSSQAKEKYKEGDFDNGVKLAKKSLVLNLVTVIFTFLAVLFIFILVMAIFGATGAFN